MNATVNDILREWRHLWPGGLTERSYSTPNLMTLCHRPERHAGSCSQDRRHKPVEYAARRVCSEGLEYAQSLVAKGLESFSLVALAEAG